ncbi:MAG TPA: TonB family protein [Pyrinomonadaceae bacterium]|jgi:TonB family protein
MLKPRKLSTPRLAIGIFICAVLITGGAHKNVRAQQSGPQVAPQTRERAFKLYEQGDIKGALSLLRAAVKEHKEDANAWYFLGLALNRDGDAKGARKAFETAVKLRPDFVEARTAWAYMLLLANKNQDAEREAETALNSGGAQNAEAQYVLAVVSSRAGELKKSLEKAEAALAVKPDFSPALLLRSEVLISLFMQETTPANAEPVALRYAHLKEAAISLEKYLALNPKVKDAAFWREQLETLRAYKDAYDDKGKPDSERTIFPPNQVTTKARILRRVEPTYTEAARQAGVRGTVVIRAILAADGIVKRILVVRSLSMGLTERAVEAARKIKFVPATKDGRPVSQYVQIEYNFNLY